tara:strand:- start:133 stop:993 length:861 start_codon:yes stop_codon:yes gene_type:complete
MGKAHNKKRNIGIIFEQLVRYISTALVNKEHSRASTALGIIREHFKPGSELYREFRLFNALVKTRVSSEGLANRILAEAREASRGVDSHNLRAQKSILIRDINHRLNDRSFYLQRIKEYRSYATIQTLLNDWRSPGTADLGKVAKYENSVCGWLLDESQGSDEGKILLEKEDVNVLTVKILTEKFNKKYGNMLNEEQQDIVKRYVFSLDEIDSSRFANDLSNIRVNTLLELKEYSKNCDNEVLNEKINEVTSRVKNLAIGPIDDSLISRFLVISKLKEELLEMGNE